PAETAQAGAQETAPAAAAPAEQPRQVAQAELPRSASSLPFIALLGLIALASAAGVRSLSRWLAVIVCILAVPIAASAQGTTTTTTTSATTPVDSAAQQNATYVPADEPYPIASHWLISGSLGSDFEADADDPG